MISKKVTEFVNVIRLDLDAKKFSKETYVQFYVESVQKSRGPLCQN